MQNCIYSSTSEAASDNAQILLIIDEEIASFFKQNSTVSNKVGVVRSPNQSLKIRKSPSRNNSRFLNTPILSSKTPKRQNINHSSTLHSPSQTRPRVELNKSSTVGMSLSAFKPPSFKKARSNKLLPPLSQKAISRTYQEQNSLVTQEEEIKLSEKLTTTDDSLRKIGLLDDQLNSILKFVNTMEDLEENEREKVYEVLFPSHK